MTIRILEENEVQHDKRKLLRVFLSMGRSEQRLIHPRTAIRDDKPFRQLVQLQARADNTVNTANQHHQSGFEVAVQRDLMHTVQ